MMCFVLIQCSLVCQSVYSQTEQWGHLKGQFVVSGDLPAISAEAIDKDQGTCMKNGSVPLDDNLVVSKEGGLRDVFVMMLLKPGITPAVHPSYENVAQQSITLDNLECRFVPHALFIRSGQKLTMKNSDDVGHNCHIITMRNEENINLAQHNSVDVVLKSPDKVPGNVVCDIHKWMDGVILVRDEPYVAISTEDGNFAIENVPTGNWTFQFWHKKAGYLAEVQAGSAATGRRGDIEVVIEADKTVDLGKITVPSKLLSK